MVGGAGRAGTAHNLPGCVPPELTARWSPFAIWRVQQIGGIGAEQQLGTALSFLGWYGPFGLGMKHSRVLTAPGDLGVVNVTLLITLLRSVLMLHSLCIAYFRLTNLEKFR